MPAFCGIETTIQAIGHTHNYLHKFNLSRKLQATKKLACKQALIEEITPCKYRNLQTKSKPEPTKKAE